MPDVPVLSPMQQAVAALKAQRARIAELEAAAAEPIAIIGMACRLPAGATTPDALWDAVRQGRDGSREVPPDRWDIDALYDPVPGRPGKMYVRKGCFIDGVDQFEPLFFRISPREAVGIDPQQRLLLELTWEALEDAAIPPPSLVGSATGVFVGISTNDYSALLSRTVHGSGSNASAGAGNAASVASGRLSYTFGFQGPCFALDTACSSSLVATHLAAQSLRNRECDLAVVAGVNLMLTPDITVNFCQGRMLSPDGACKTFDAGADGYARGEGSGVVLLRRLSDAQAAGDRVLAVIRGSAVNQDGRSAGLTAPNGLAQEAVIRQALDRAGIGPDAVDYIEAHGTGTALGDPIEMHALKAVFAGRRRPLHVGSVKTNIGHTEAAAGVSGLIKAVLMLQHQELPPTLHFSRLNPHIELDGVDIQVPAERTASPLAVIGVSSFGFSGTNAHIVLGAAPPPLPSQAAAPNAAGAEPPQLFLSARSPEALRALIAAYRDHLATTTDRFADVCHTAAVGRARLPWWVLVPDAAGLADAVPSNAPPPTLPPTHGRRVALPKVVFQRERFWVDGEAAVPEVPVAAPDDGGHPLLGRNLVLPFSTETRWDAAIDPARPALRFLAEHSVDGRTVLPAAALIEMALAAYPGRAVTSFAIPAPFPLPEGAPRRAQVIGQPGGAFQIVSYASGEAPIVHASGTTVVPEPAAAPAWAGGGAPLDPAALYAAMAQRGVVHGPAFRLLRDIQRRDGAAQATLLPAGNEAGFGIHPARLDAAFQLVAAALRDEAGATLMPARIGRITLHHTPAAEAGAQVVVRRTPEAVFADVTILDAAGVAVAVQGLEFRTAAADQAFYRIDWRPQPLAAATAGFLPSAAALSRVLGPAAAVLAQAHGMAAYAEAERGLEAVATGFVIQALRRLNFDARPGSVFTFGATAEALGVAPRHHRLLRHVFGMLVADGVLARHGRGWRVLTPLPEVPAAEVTEPALANEVAVLNRCGAALPEVLTGHTDPLTLLFPPSGPGAGAFYADSAYARTVNALLARAAEALAAATPAGRPLRILEVGGGTGGATGAVLGAIPAALRRYTFTDVSPAFLTAAAARFGDGVETRLLDLEQPPGPQGFTPGTFDVVLAANVLHATSDLRRSLSHLHSLMAPGGTLLLVESTTPRRWVDIVFGLTSGWWRFTDVETRPDHPLLTLDRWRSLLAECGFETADGASEVIAARRGAGQSWFVEGDAPGLVDALTAAGHPSAPADTAQGWLAVVPPAGPGEAGQAALLGHLVRIARDALARATPPRLVFVADATPGHAGVAGFVTSLALEAPALRPALLTGAPDPAAMVDELGAPETEAEVRWNAAGQREVPRLVAAAGPAAQDISGAWLITGGHGGLGMAIAGWLGAHGASAVVLLGRTPRETAAIGATPVRSYTGDAADAALVGRILRDHAITGVVHAAGLLADAPIAEQTPSMIERVLHPKIGGALALDAATRAHPVRHFVLCASVAGVIGAARQTNHAFCSSWLDGLARQRRAEGLPGISLDWGVWRQVGSAAALGFDSRAEQLGLGSIGAVEGAALFGRALNSDAAQLLVLPSVDWPRFAGHFGAAVPGLLRGLTAPPSAQPPSPVASPQTQPDRRDALERIVRTCLGLTGAVDSATPLNELGLDSLVAVEIRNQLAAALAIEVSIRELIEGASLASLASKLAPGPSATPDQPDAVLSVIASVLGLKGAVDTSAPLHELGLDSLMAVEIKNRLAAEAGVEVSVRELIEGATIAALQGRSTRVAAAEPVPAADEAPDGQNAPFPLTDMQQAYWLGRRDDMALGSVGCVLYTEFDTSEVDLDRAEAAWNVLVRRHDMLRAVIHADGTQQVLPTVPYYRFERLALDVDAEATLTRLRETLPLRVAEPGRWPLFDIRVTRFGATARLHMAFDLIALDAASIHTIRLEWGQLYEDLAAPLPPIGTSFRDVVLAQRSRRGTEAWRRSEAYWRARAATLPGGPELPTVNTAAAGRFIRHRTVIDPATAAALRQQAQSRGLTVATLLAAAYAETLAGWSRSRRFCITLTAFSRPPSSGPGQPALGDYTSTILLEVDAGMPGFGGRAAALARQLAVDLDHAELGGIEVLREVARQTGVQAAPIPVVFTSALGFRRGAAPAAEASGWDRLGTTVYNVSSTPQVLIDHQVSEEDGALLCHWDVLEAKFPPGVVAAMVAGHASLLRRLAVGEGWDAPVSAVLPPLHRAPMLAAAAPDLLHAAFERAARAHPARPAVIAPDLTLDYGTLDALATHMAAGLLPLLGGIVRDRLVAVEYAKGWRQVAAVLAVLKAGAAYLPLDPAWPESRRRHLVAAAEAIVPDPAYADAALAAVRAGAPLPVIPPVDDPTRLAYVIYTSGSTGTPKGVMVEHAAAVTTVHEVNRRWALQPTDRTIALASLSFDLSVFDIFGPLGAGGAVVMPDTGAVPDPARWADLLLRHQVTVWNSVPALLAIMLEHGLPPGLALRLVLLSGDWVPIATIARLRQQSAGTTAVALGGATEAAIWSNAHEAGVLDPDWPSIPYGAPLAGQRLHVVDADGADCPDWVTGEIEIAGQGLARGYWRDPAQTAARFRLTATGERRYRTGDLGRFRPYNGGPAVIEFLGREDNQVKIGGHRIELGEVEAALAAHPAVMQAVAAALGERDRTLHAFVVLREPGSAGVAWQPLVDAATAAAGAAGQPISREHFELTAETFTDQAARAAAAAVCRLTGSESLPSAETLIARHGVAPRYRHWLERMLPEIARVGMAGAPPPSRSLAGVDRFGFEPAALDVLDRVIASLPDILTEREHSATIYLSAETPDIYARLFAAPNAAVAAAVRERAVQGRISILEVGGGLGTTLTAIEASLPADRIAYHFTDISPHLVRLTAARLAGRPWLTTGTLDFDRPAPEHEGRFDVIIASSALHVAADVAATLCHLRSWLAPGGVLVALEQTRFFPWFDLSMGLQAGFDARTDLALRPHHPLLSRAAWLDQLARAGFARAAVAAAPGTVADRLGFDVILAQGSGPGADAGGLVAGLRDHLRQRLPAYMVPANITAIPHVPLSPNGKVDRQALRPAAVSGASATGRLAREVGETVAAALQAESVDPDRSLFELGASSLTLVGLQRALATRFGRTIPLQRIFAAPTVTALAAAIADPAAPTSPMVSFGPAAGRPVLLMMPGILSLPFYLRDLAAALADVVALVSVQLPGMAEGEVPIDTIEGQAEYVVQQVRAAGLRGPYRIGGHSFGGLVAIEVARRLRAAGEAVPLLLLGDTVRTTSRFEALQSDAVAQAAMLRALEALHGPVPEAAGLPPTEALQLAAAQMQAAGSFGALDLPLTRMAALFKANFRAIGRYRPGPIDGDVALIRTEGGFPSELRDHEPGSAADEPGLGWASLVAGRLDIHTIPGDHLGMLAAPNLPRMAAVMAALVRAAGP